MSTPLSGRRPHPTPAAGSLPAVAVPASSPAARGPSSHSLPRTDPPPRVSKARALYLQHHAQPDNEAAFVVIGAVLDELDDVHEETIQVSQRQTALEQQMSEGFRNLRGGLTNLADDMLKTADAVRRNATTVQHIETTVEGLETRLMLELGNMSRQDSSHDMADAQLEARIIAADKAREEAEKQAATDREHAATEREERVKLQVAVERHEKLFTARNGLVAMLGGIPIAAIIKIIAELWGAFHK